MPQGSGRSRRATRAAPAPRGRGGGSCATTGAYLVTTGCIAVTTLLALVAFYEVALSGSPLTVNICTWIDLSDLHVSWSLLFDDLTVSMENIYLALSVVPFFKMGKGWANIFYRLDGVALAHWIMCDVKYGSSRDSFTNNDVVRLFSLSKYNIRSSMH